MKTENPNEESEVVDVMDLVEECDDHALEIVGPDDNGVSKAVCKNCGYETDL
jgi:hypothetical protein